MAIVTGGTRGIGKDIALQLLSEGFFVIVLYKKVRNEVRTFETSLKRKKARAVFIECDISKKEEVIRAVQEIKNITSHVDVLVNNAGIINNDADETLNSISDEDLDELMQTNFFGGLRLTKQLLPLLKKSKQGRIIFLNTALSFIGSPRRFGYIVSKTANVGAVRALALELAPSNICVNAVVPGYIQTRMSNFHGEELKKKLQKIPLERIGTPGEVANLVSFLASEKSAYITGQHIHINGGLFLA
ncbi:SDR family oxidoreductase [Patescibacteria group bacterium]|nr:SDR family oxidoreductase [Patescibacteria group bacterium]